MENDESIIFHTEAFAELEQAHTWYEEQAPGIGDVFFQEVQYAVARIHETPEAWPAYSHGTKRFLLHRFPYAVVYRVKTGTVQVFTVMHLKRKSGYWNRRRF